MNGEPAFVRTTRALEADNSRRSQAGLLTAAALFAGWSWWMLSARVTVHEVSGSVNFESPLSIVLSAAGVRNP